MYDGKENAAVDWKETRSKIRTSPLSCTHAIIMSNCHESSLKSPHNWTLGLFHSTAELWQLPQIWSCLTSVSPLLLHLFVIWDWPVRSITFIILLSYLKAFTKFRDLESNLVSLALYSRFELFTFLFICFFMHLLLKSYRVIPTFSPSVFIPAGNESHV